MHIKYVNAGLIRAGMWVIALALLSAPGVVQADEVAFAKRQHLLAIFEAEGASAIQTLVQALDDESALVRRTAAHLLVRIGEPARGAFVIALENRDFQVRHIIIDGIVEMDLLRHYWLKILMDDHPAIRRDIQLVLLRDHALPKGEAFAELTRQLAQAYVNAPASRRQHIVELFASFDALTEQARQLLIQATADQEPLIRETAYEGIVKHIGQDWQEAETLLRAAEVDESEAVRQLGVELRWKLLEVAQVRLPAESWSFKTDPQQVGQEQSWFEPTLDDHDWRADAVIEAPWHTFLEYPYVGVGWYRRTVHLPAFPRWDRAYLEFSGVDESAQVWMNGEYVGEHDIGVAGWDMTFILEVTAMIRPGEVNQVTVMAKNIRGSGGIWQPVRLRVLDSKAVARN